MVEIWDDYEVVGPRDARPARRRSDAGKSRRAPARLERDPWDDEGRARTSDPLHRFA